MTYLIRARLRRDAGGSDGALVKLVAENALTPGRRHDLVWTLFGDTAERDRDFVFRMDPAGDRPGVLAYAARPPHADAERIWHVDHKPFTPQLFPGDRIRFNLRCNPVRQRGNQRIDEVYDTFRREREAARAAGQPDPDRLEIAQSVGQAWLGRRADALGIALDGETVRAHAYRTESVYKAGRRQPFTLAVLDLTGEAEVVDPQALSSALPNGIGKGKAYGCGLMLIARAPSAG